MTVLLDNGTKMKTQDGKYIEGKKKDAYWLNFPDEKRLANNEAEYDLSLESCSAVTEAQDASFFLLQLAAHMALPVTFEVR